MKLVGIAGPSCAGKGTLCQWLANRLGAGILPIDSYYRPLDHLSPQERDLVNFDEPFAIEAPLLVSDLEKLARGEAVYRPVYDFARHTRDGRTVVVSPGEFVLIEGLFTLYWPEVRRLLFVSIFIDAPDDVCLNRRIARDQAERSRTRTSVEAQYERTVSPMRARYIDPTLVYANLVLDGGRPVDEIGQAALDFLEGKV